MQETCTFSAGNQKWNDPYQSIPDLFSFKGISLPVHSQHPIAPGKAMLQTTRSPSREVRIRLPLPLFFLRPILVGGTPPPKKVGSKGAPAGKPRHRFSPSSASSSASACWGSSPKLSPPKCRGSSSRDEINAWIAKLLLYSVAVAGFLG